MIGQLVKEIRYQSFYIDDELVEKFNKIFLLLELDGWISVTVSEGKAIISKENEPALKGVAEIVDEFKYPVNILSDKVSLPDRLMSVNELLYDLDQVVGIIFRLGRINLLFVVDDNDDMMFWPVKEV